jgi:predicted nucleotidyltransferase
MENSNIEKVVRRISGQLRRALNPEAVYLFGSHARGDAGEESDLDFLVVVKESNQPRSKRDQEARAVVTDRSVAKDILVITLEEWRRGLKVVASLPSTVAREGKLLYER